MKKLLKLLEVQIKVITHIVIRKNASTGIFSLFHNNCVSGYTIETLLDQHKKQKSPTLKEYLCHGAFIYLNNNWGYILDEETSISNY